MARRYSLCLALVALALPGAAQASTASVSGNTLTVTDGAEGSDIDLYLDCNEFNTPACTGNLSITDKTGITPGAGCSARSATEVLCPGAGISLSQVALGGGDDDWYDHVGLGDTVSGGAGNDTIDGGSGRDDISGGDGDDKLSDFGDDEAAGDPAGVTIDGGAGNDELSGSGADDFLAGGPGNDELGGFVGNDEIEGGDGDDVIDSPLSGASQQSIGADDLSGGDGFDEVGYSSRSEPVTVTLDNEANDGVAGEGDNVRADVDRVIGSLAADTLTGTDGPETFDANDGDDTVEARGGDDTVNGSSGDDTLEGGDGDDTMDGGRANDLITGGPGRDNIVDDARITSLGGDTIRVRDGERDQVTCYGGGDIVEADQLDVVDSLCEEIERRTVDGGDGGGGGGVISGLAKSIGIPKFLRRGVRFGANIPRAGRHTVALVISARIARRYGLGRGQTILGGFRRRFDAGDYDIRIDELRAFRRKLRRLANRPGFTSMPAFVAIVRGDDTVAAKKLKLTG